MPEQGPTEAEVTLIFGGPKPKSMDCQCSGSSVQCRAHQWRAAEAVALKLDALTRARHVREAVEGLSPDNMERLSRSLVTAYRRAADALEDRLGRADGRAVEDKTLHLRRAALRDALGGTDTTTPNPQNRP